MFNESRAGQYSIYLCNVTPHFFCSPYIQWCVQCRSLIESIDRMDDLGLIQRDTHRKKYNNVFQATINVVNSIYCDEIVMNSIYGVSFISSTALYLSTVHKNNPHPPLQNSPALLKRLLFNFGVQGPTRRTEPYNTVLLSIGSFSKVKSTPQEGINHSIKGT